MKYNLIVLYGLLCSSVLTAAYYEAPKILALSKQESERVQWFETMKRQLKIRFKSLPLYIQHALCKQSYEDHFELVEAAMNTYVQMVFNQAPKKGHYHAKEDIVATLLKIKCAMQKKAPVQITDEITARIHVFVHMLNYEERMSFTKKHFMQHNEFACVTIAKYARLLAQELACHQLIHNTPESIKEHAQHLEKQKIEELLFEYQYQESDY